MFLRLALSFLAAVLAIAARADPPRVAADITPVHSLVARVMAGVAVPDLLMRPGASPHGYAMRPSEAAALQAADLVVWIGPELTPWLARSTKSLGKDAEQIVLLHADGTLRHPSRTDAALDHGHHGHDHEDHPADHEEPHHGEKTGEEAVAQDHHEAHGRAHGHDLAGTVDPHAWLDPENARVWLDLIAGALVRIDPENAQTYGENADAARAELAALSAEIRDILAPVQGAAFLVYHDAYQYFERRFDLRTVGAIAVSDATAPGPARIAELRALVAAETPRCAFYEPQFSPKLVDTVARGTGLRQAELDPIGQALTPGPELYPALLSAMARGLAECL